MTSKSSTKPSHDIIDLTMEDDTPSSLDAAPIPVNNPQIKLEPMEAFDQARPSIEITESPTVVEDQTRKASLPTEPAQADIEPAFIDNLADMLTQYHNNTADLRDTDPRNVHVVEGTSPRIYANDGEPAFSGIPDEDSDPEEREAEEVRKAEIRALEVKVTTNQATAFDEVTLAKLRSEQAKHLKRRQKQQQHDLLKQQRQRQASPMFVSESEDESSRRDRPAYSEAVSSTSMPSRGKGKTRAKGKRSQRGREARSSSENASHDIADGRTSSSLRGRSTRGKIGARVAKHSSRGRAKKGRSRRNHAPEMLNLASLAHDDIVGHAQINVTRPTQPGFTSKNRKDALNQLMASITTDQRQYQGTKKALDDACKVFRSKGHGTMHADGADGWRLKGMKTSLKHFQLLSVAWAVRRERNDSAPYGGILADTMGFGKTIQMISVMVENKPKPGARNNTTLIVCPSSICLQWLQEIEKHVQRDNFKGGTLIYRSGARIESANVVETLSKYSVIVTTYREVMSNYPKCVPPSYLTTEVMKDRWWAKYYADNCGPLLRMTFHRIILDEAQIIKNHESRTSKACRLLAGKYRWIVSGTPLSNCLEEFYPYFQFLGVAGAGDCQLFQSNYCARSEASMARLNSMLQTVMVRRTHADRLFDRPLVSLPNLDHGTIYLDFDTTEKVIYNIVRYRFVVKLHTWSKNGQLGGNTRNILVMLLRLRQMCSHVLMITNVIRRLLEPEDIVKLWSLTKTETSDHTKKQIAQVVRQFLENGEATRGTEEPLAITDGTTSIEGATDHSVSDALAVKFRMSLDDLCQKGAWNELYQKSLCHFCHDIPVRGRLTVPCGHLFCEDCINMLRSHEDAAQIKCTACDNVFGEVVSVGALDGLGADGPRMGQPYNHGRDNAKSSKKDEMSWLALPGACIMSTKAQEVKKLLQDWLTRGPEIKVVIFTLWVPMLKVLAHLCTQNGWGTEEFSGQMSNTARQLALGRWRKVEGGKQVLLASMQSSGLGLNLTEACYVIIVDPWWNEAQENQAFSRVFRIGQVRDCVVRRLLIKEAIDTQLLLKLQERKTAEIGKVMDERPNTQLTIQDVIKLFGAAEHDRLSGEETVSDNAGGDEFVMAEDQYVQTDSDDEGMIGAPARDL